jgi:hypothetical protein
VSAARGCRVRASAVLPWVPPAAGFPLRLLLTALFAATTLGACGTAPPAHPPSAEIAYGDLRRAVHDRTRDSLWRTLDGRTRDTWLIAWRTRRATYEMLPLLEREHVNGDPELRALPPAPPPRPEDFFVASFSDSDWADLAARFDPAARLIELGKDAEALTPTGDRLTFRKSGDGTWGYAGLAEVARQTAQRELGMLDRVGALIELQTPGLRSGSMPWR